MPLGPPPSCEGEAHKGEKREQEPTEAHVRARGDGFGRETGLGFHLAFICDLISELRWTFLIASWLSHNYTGGLLGGSPLKMVSVFSEADLLSGPPP